MANIKLTQLPLSDRRDSDYTLEQLIYHISGTTPANGGKDPYLEMILCLSNEIKDLKDKE
jgi:hypothetical protein